MVSTSAPASFFLWRKMMPNGARYWHPLVLFLKRHGEGLAFLSSGTFILDLLCSAAMGLYPNVLPSNTDPGRSLTVASVSASGYGLRIGLWWFVPAFALALTYSAFVYRHFNGKVAARSHHQ
jgi:cytochrome d ubiquinol oxidase subunit II